MSCSQCGNGLGHEFLGDGPRGASRFGQYCPRNFFHCPSSTLSLSINLISQVLNLQPLSSLCFQRSDGRWAIDYFEWFIAQSMSIVRISKHFMLHFSIFTRYDVRLPRFWNTMPFHSDVRWKLGQKLIHASERNFTLDHSSWCHHSCPCSSFFKKLFLRL